MREDSQPENLNILPLAAGVLDIFLLVVVTLIACAMVLVMLSRRPSSTRVAHASARLPILPNARPATASNGNPDTDAKPLKSRPVTFDQRINQYGLKEHGIDGDGHCQFAAVLYAYQKNNGEPWSSMNASGFRGRVVDWMSTSASTRDQIA
jgi:hypothetical protein